MSARFSPSEHRCPACRRKSLRWVLAPTDYPTIKRDLFCPCGWRGSRLDLANAARAAHQAPQPASPSAGDALDAARYRWLRDNINRMTGKLPIVVVAPKSYVAIPRGKAFLDGGIQCAETLDAAIDAALSAAAQHETGDV